jgi:hypothetical protein
VAKPLRDGLLPEGDAGRYELARTLKAEEEARKLRRINEEAAGSLVLRSAVEVEISRQIGQEVAEFESVLRTASRTVADRLSVDERTVRQILTETWRAHRGARTAVLQDRAKDAGMTAEESGEDF